MSKNKIWCVWRNKRTQEKIVLEDKFLSKETLVYINYMNGSGSVHFVSKPSAQEALELVFPEKYKNFAS